MDDMNDQAMLELLQSPGPDADLRTELALFGQFVGSWKTSLTNYFPDGGSETVLGAWRFSWVLQGRAVQDVFVAPWPADSAGGRYREYGTTVRFYDPSLGLWRIVWCGPVRGRQVLLRGRPVGDEIVLDGVENDVRLQWIFSDVQHDSFRWRAIESQDDGRTWKTVQEMGVQRAG
jgi:hypothetical protein